MIEYIVISMAGFILVLLVLVITTNQKARPMLWKIEMDSPSYLLASLHAGIHKREIHQRIWQRLKKCRVVVFENRCDEEESKELHCSLSLSEALGSEYWKKVEQTLGLRCAKQIQNCEPWQLGVILTYCAYPDGKGVERSLKQKAHNKKICGLESMNTVPQILREIYNVEMIKELLDNDPKPQIYKMIDVYKSGNAQKLNKDHLATMPDILKKKLVWQRNKNWMPQIEHHIREGNAFIVVGAFHLVGDHSVIELLRNKGYKIHREKC
ncbi:TraB/GumN family protein [Candidatus Uabimicrobium amorphum]|uniref:GumN protein n=1 Tax=Uabimicrobium amorphum TaxID=2596890 RepID=A0A5S9IIH5_UABAM|nr:TraB/GumN family protein [Candidatus Uabimicrobium amorphum]BBM82161.1 GumN protein [Candidatus Uabimicrobium amorphum]